jgi:hypothetical protein
VTVVCGWLRWVVFVRLVCPVSLLLWDCPSSAPVPDDKGGGLKMGVGELQCVAGSFRVSIGVPVAVGD